MANKATELDLQQDPKQKLKKIFRPFIDIGTLGASSKFPYSCSVTPVHIGGLSSDSAHSDHEEKVIVTSSPLLGAITKAVFMKKTPANLNTNIEEVSSNDVSSRTIHGNRKKSNTSHSLIEAGAHIVLPDPQKLAVDGAHISKTYSCSKTEDEFPSTQQQARANIFEHNQRTWNPYDLKILEKGIQGDDDVVISPALLTPQAFKLQELCTEVSTISAARQFAPCSLQGSDVSSEETLTPMKNCFKEQHNASLFAKSSKQNSGTLSKSFYTNSVCTSEMDSLFDDFDEKDFSREFCDSSLPSKGSHSNKEHPVIQITDDCYSQDNKQKIHQDNVGKLSTTQKKLTCVDLETSGIKPTTSEVLPHLLQSVHEYRVVSPHSPESNHHSFSKMQNGHKIYTCSTPVCEDQGTELLEPNFTSSAKTDDVYADYEDNYRSKCIRKCFLHCHSTTTRLPENLRCDLNCKIIECCSKMKTNTFMPPCDDNTDDRTDNLLSPLRTGVIDKVVDISDAHGVSGMYLDGQSHSRFPHSESGDSGYGELHDSKCDGEKNLEEEISFLKTQLATVGRICSIQMKTVDTLRSDLKSMVEEIRKLKKLQHSIIKTEKQELCKRRLYLLCFLVALSAIVSSAVYLRPEIQRWIRRKFIDRFLRGAGKHMTMVELVQHMLGITKLAAVGKQ